MGRAIRAGWDVDKSKVSEALWEVINTKDPELMLEAAKLLLLADGIDVKREELAAKQAAKDDEHRLRLLELAKRLPVGELARIASEHGIVDAGESTSDTNGRAGTPTPIDGEEASGTA